jgi:hypothetical protein
VAPVAQPIDFAIAGLGAITSAQQAQVQAAIAGALALKGNPLGTVPIYQSDIDAAIAAVPGLPSFAVLTPSSWPITPSVGNLLTLGTVTF